MDNIILTKYISLLKTKDELNVFLEQLQELRARLYSTDKSLDSLDELFSVEKKNLLELSMKKNNVSVTHPIQMESFIGNMIDSLIKIPIIEVTLAVEPTVTIVKKITEWLSTAKVVAVVDYKVDTTIAGGAVFAYNGLRKDYSLQSKLIQLTS